MKQTRLLFPSRRPALVALQSRLRGKTYDGARFFILLDENTYTHCLPRLIGAVPALEEADFFEVPTGEEAKQPEIAWQLWRSLSECDADRRAVLLCLGGGCVSDIGGFVASTYRRGLRTICVPTTLVGMVDAAIGGKTALDLDGIKNVVGTFHMPDLVCIDPAFLDTLPADELRAGLCEMLKTLALCDADRYHALLAAVTAADVTLQDEDLVRCAQFKQAVAAADPHDLGIRKMLNLGHTFGHALESHAAQQGRPLSHGDAVGIGMDLAFYLSVRKLGFPEAEWNAFRTALSALRPLPHFSLKDTESVLSFMRHDKKNEEQQIRCVLMKEVGVPVVDVPVDENEVRDALLHL